ncbi:hypothetical protein [Burkholderia pyrrocinia]
MGQALLLSDTPESFPRASTTGCGPCLGVAVIYRSNQTARAILAHLQPEADHAVFAEKILAVFPDDVCADVQLHITTTKSDVSDVAERQQSSFERLISEIAEKYDYVVFDDDNVLRHDSPSLSVDMATLQVSTSLLGSAEFSGADLDYMEAQMKRDAASLHYFR